MKSRRIFKRHVKRKHITKNKKIQNQTLHRLRNMTQRCLTTHGFQSNPNQKIKINFNEAITKPTPSFFQQPSNLAFHNLCSSNLLPNGARELLGLNLNFCLASRSLPTNINQTMLKLAYSIRTKHYLEENQIENETEYIKQLYVKNRNWHPPPASNTIEEGITKFEKLLKQAHNSLQKMNLNKNLSNLTPLQSHALNSLKRNRDIVIKATDKNLGPVAIDLSRYTQQVLQEHLLTNDYQQLSKDYVTQKMELIRNHLKELINQNQKQLSKAELVYFQRSLKIWHRLPIFYGLPKIHKNPISLRPVVSTTNSLLAVFSVWIDQKMKCLLPFVTSYIKNSTTVINDLQYTDLPEGAKAFTADATSMYTNIDTDLGLQSVSNFIQTNSNNLPPNFPANLFLEILGVVMRNNMFSFGDTFWLQKTGTAMGTPSACAYATISYGHYENTNILPCFRNNLFYYRRYIDDVFGIWLPVRDQPENTWENFKRVLDGWGTLRWKIEEPSDHATFLDLNIHIKNSSVKFSTYQKPLNLYLYLPPLSAHPLSCLKGLIKGEMQRYWLQNSARDFEELVTNFIQRLHKRGHSIEHLSKLFHQAANSLDNAARISRVKDRDNGSTLFIHWPYHPNGLQNNAITKIYKETLEPHLSYNKAIIAISRPPNLKDTLTKATLSLPDGKTIQQQIATLNNPAVK